MMVKKFEKIQKHNKNEKIFQNIFSRNARKRMKTKQQSQNSMENSTENKKPEKKGIILLKSVSLISVF